MDNKHTETPYHVEPKFDWVKDVNNKMVANCTGHSNQHADAHFIVKACNNHDKLVAMLRQLLRESTMGHEHFRDAQQAKRMHVTLSTLLSTKELLANIEEK